MDIQTAIQVLIQAASVGKYNKLEQVSVDQAILACSKLKVTTEEPVIKTKNDAKEETN